MKTTIVITILLLIVLSILVIGFLVYNQDTYTKTGIIVKHPIFENIWGIKLNTLLGKEYFLEFQDLPHDYRREGRSVKVTYTLDLDDYDNTPGWNGYIYVVNNKIDFVE